MMATRNGRTIARIRSDAPKLLRPCLALDTRQSGATILLSFSFVLPLSLYLIFSLLLFPSLSPYSLMSRFVCSLFRDGPKSKGSNHRFQFKTG